jgi:hypothetical protein
MQLKTTHVLMELSLKYITVKLLVNAWVSILVDLVGHKTHKLKKYIYLYIYFWKLNQTVLELDLWAVKFLFFPQRDLKSGLGCWM